MLSTPMNTFISNVIKQHTNDRLEGFCQYTQEIETKFAADKVELERKYNTQIADLTPDQVKEVNDYYSDDFYTIEEIYLGQYRRSTLVSIYSFLENVMNILCRHLRKRNGYALAVEDLNGKGIVRARNYLEKVAGIDFASLNGEWSQLSTFNKIRNCIVHNEGTAAKNEKLIELIESTSGLALLNERSIVVERAYVDQCITIVEDFLSKLYKQAL